MSDTLQDMIQVLHVDDEPDFADLTGTFLERQNDRFVVETATSADEGLEGITDRPPDCIISDYDMPGMDGIEFLETVREEYPNLPFILYTGKGSEEVAADAISAGVSDYLQKEAGIDQYRVLANRITNLVRQSRAETRVEQYAKAQEESERYRQELLELMSDLSRSDDEKVDRLLALGCERLGVENGHLVMIDDMAGEHNVISVDGSDVVREGVTDLSTTYCRKTIESDDILDLHHAGDQGWDGDPAYEAFGLECYIGGKLTVDDTLFGTLCFVDAEPREPFTHNEKTFFNLLLQWCNRMVERRRRLNQAEAIFDHTQDAIFLIDVNNEETFRIRSVNRAYEEMTSLSMTELHGQTPRELLGDEQGGEVETRFRECVTKREPIEYEEKLTLDGQTFDFQTRLAPVIEEEMVVQLVGATRDITERKQREQKLELVETLFDHAQECQFITEVVDGEFKLRHANDYYKRTLGLSPSEPVTGQTPSELFGDTGGQEILDRYGECVETRESVTYTVELPVPEEGTVYRTILTPVVSEDEVTHIVGTARKMEQVS